MDEKRQKIIDSYSDGNEKNRAVMAGTYGMEFLYTKKFMNEYIGLNMSVVEIGCGGGYYGIYYSDKCKKYLGIDLTPVNIEAFRKTIKEKNLTNVSAEIGDATSLDNINDCGFDVVMCLGPMYHLDREGRLKCISECKRICKDGGIIAFAYINKTGAIAKYGNMVGWDKVLNNRISEFVLDKGTDDVKTDIFFYTMPEEIASDVKNADLNIIKNVGLDILLDDNEIAQFSDQQRNVWFKIADLMNSSPSCIGISNHALLICKK